MALEVVIGSATLVSFGTGTPCVLSAQWGFNPGRQEAYCLGSFDPSDSYTVYKPTYTLSLTVYASSSVTVDVTPSINCDPIATVAASVSPGTCASLASEEGATASVSGDWYVQSYGYSKASKDQAGQESWSLIQYTSTTGGSATGIVPSHVLIATSTGEKSDTSNETGVVFSSAGAHSQGSSGSVSANSMGTSSDVYYGIVVTVGGPTTDMAYVGNGSASISLNPLYI